MVERGPEVHGDGADLDFAAHGAHLIGEIDRDFHDHVIAAVAVFLGLLDVVLDGDDPHVRLVGEHAGDLVDVVDVGAQHADAGDVGEVLRHVLDRDLIAELFQLARDGGRLFEPALDELDGVAAVAHRHVLGEHLQLGAHFKDRTMIAHHHFLVERLFGEYMFAVRRNDICVNRRRAAQLIVSHGPFLIPAAVTAAAAYSSLYIVAYFARTVYAQFARTAPFHLLRIFSCLIGKNGVS